MATIPEGTIFIGFNPNDRLTEKRSALINAESGYYTIEEIIGEDIDKTYWFPSVTTSVQHDRFIGKSIYQFEIISGGTELVTQDAVTYNNGTGTFTFASQEGQAVRVNYWANYELVE